MQETRYRARHLDLIANPHVRDIFVTRARIVSFIRRYFDSRGFLEVRRRLLPAFMLPNARKLRCCLRPPPFPADVS